MRASCRFMFAAVAAPCFAVAPLGAQAIRGRVTELGSGAGVPAAEVAVFRDGLPVANARTDSTGFFFVEISEIGAYQMLARRVGFFGGVVAEVKLATRDTFELLVRMERIVQTLQTLKVEGARAGIDFTRGFDERRSKGIGTFLSRQQIERKGFQRAPELVYGLPGYQLMPDATERFGQPISVIVSTRASGLGACTPALFVDGFPVDPESLYRDYSSNDIESIEAYQSSQVPARFSMGRSLCGVVLFWTRSRSGKDP